MADPGDDHGSETDWKFSVEEFPDEWADEGDQAEGDGTAGVADDEDGGNITGSLASDEPLEPGDIDPENAFFVLLGVALVAGLILGTMVGL